MFRRIAIVNRGEAAMRLLHAVRDLNALGTGPRVETVALHTEGERTAMFVREADLAYNLGPASARPYLDLAVLERALLATGADAAWVGWGFVAEDPAFAELCDRIGVTFVGPSPEAMRRLGDKIGAKLLAEEAGVPVAAWSNGSVDDLEEALDHAHRIGYPLMLKAAAGGGGRGIRVVTNDPELTEVFERTRDEAMRAFGSGVVFLERLVTGARHIEVQLISDGSTAWAVGVRDCSVQRRNQKLIEESSSPALSPEQEQLVKEAAARLAVSVGYRGAATAEFLYQPQERAFSFLEVNTRLQVEHPVTELTTGLDLVRLQLHVAAGGRLEGPVPPASGHAVEARLNAEDPDRDFAPAPGRIAVLRQPVGPGVRVDTGVAEGDVIPADFDSMIAKVIAYGPTREDALARLRRALTDTIVVIEGGTTNKSFLLDLLARPEVIDGSADTGWIDRERARGGLVNHRDAGVALVAAGIDAYDEAERGERARFFATAHGGRPEARHALGRAFDLKLRGSTHKVEVAQVGPHGYRVTVDGTQVDAVVEQLQGHTVRLVVEGVPHRVVTAAHAADHLVEVDGTVHRVTKDEGGVLRAPAPALVVSVAAAVGDEVAAGAPVVVLESMKMETLLPAPFAGRVKELLVAPNDQVGAGQPLLRLEPLADADAAGPADAAEQAVVELPERGTALDGEAQAVRLLGDLESMILGYDVRADAGRRAATAYGEVRDALGGRRRQLLDAELTVLTVFADLCELTRNRPHAEEGADDRVHSPREYFHAYLHSLDVDRERLPEDFRGKLARVLAHYGVTTLDRGPDLEEAVFRVFLSQQRTQSHLPVVTALLQRWLADEVPAGEASGAPEWAPSPVDRAREVLDRLVLATQLRFPTIGDLARSARFRWFEAPIVEAAREEAYAEVRDQLEYLSEHPDAGDYAERVEALVASPEPLVRFLAERIARGVPEVEPLVEVLARRHYREHDLALDETRGCLADGRPCVIGEYEINDARTRLVSTITTLGDIEATGRELAEILGGTPAGQDAVVDLYLAWPDAPADADAAAAALAGSVGGLPVVQRLRRIAVMVAANSGGRVHQFTFRPDGAGGVVEDALVRGMHPMVGRRLNLWRLRDFTITRLPSAEDVLLYHCVAPGNESDQRLVALAQVRELSIVRDHAGHVTSLPQAERAVASCLDAIRRARTASGGDGARLDMNHVWLYIWPTIGTPVQELTALKRTVAPLTVGAGIEEVVAQGRIALPGEAPIAVSARFSYQPGSGVVASVSGPPTERLRPLDDYAQKVLRSRRRGTVYPYEVVPLLTGPAHHGGSFVEHDLDDMGRLVPVDRAPGGNKAGLVVGVVRTPSRRYPEGTTRVVLLGDPTRSLGALAEAECARVCAALDLAEELGAPVEWFALSSGARISMDNGTENMDWVARALRRIVEFTQRGGEINIIVTGINVGAQPYWNAEATMLMHTKGILVMTPESAMVLTGKQSLDYSGGVSAEDNFGIGGYDRVMGPNGQAQYWAPDLAAAVGVLVAHYDHAYVAPGERTPRPAPTTDPRDRDVRDYPHEHPDSDFRTVGDIFSARTNPERKKAFDIRTLMRAVADQDHPTLERWAGMAEAETAVVLDAHLGGHPVCLLGIESRPVPRRGFPPTDGPDTWTAGTLFPQSSKKAARAINAASGVRPLVVLANLSGFDGSPESMRRWQLEYGAEIGRAVVNFDGPIVFCVVSRYHGGAFVVFSKTLNDTMQVLAVEGSYASVIGGAPAAGVVFTGEVDRRTRSDPRVAALEKRAADASDVERARIVAELADVRAAVRSEKLGEVAAEFDAVHSIERAVAVGSVDAIISAAELRPRLIDAVERGLASPR